MDERAELDSILNSQPDAAPQIAEPTVATPEVKQDAPAEAAPGAKAEAGPPPVSQETNEGPHVPRKALEDERRKRQELERQIEQLTKQAPQSQQPQAQPQYQQPADGGFPPRPDPYEDPHGAIEWDRAVNNYQIFATRVAMSEHLMRSTKPDFDEKIEIFRQAASQSPSLIQELKAHAMPMQYAYELGRRIAGLREIGDDPFAYKERLRKEWEAEVQQSQGQPQQLQSSPAIQAPKSLASTPSTQPRRTNGQFAGKAELSDILGG